MKSTIFTPAVIEQINTFIAEEIYCEHIPKFEIEKSSEFKQAIQDAESGKNEFEIYIDLDEAEDEDIFNSLISDFFEGYYFGYKYRYMTRVTLRIDREDKSIELGACLVLAHYSGIAHVAEEFVVYQDDLIPLRDYIEMQIDDIDEIDCYRENDDYDEYRTELYERIREKAMNDFVDAETYNPSESYDSTVLLF